MSAPRAWVMVQSAGACSRKPSRTVRVSSRVALGEPVRLAGGAGPVAELAVLIVRVGADDGDGARGRGAECAPVGPGGEATGQGQRAVVGEQDEGAAGDLEVEVEVLGAADHRALELGVGAAGVLEQAEVELQGEDPGDGGVDELLVEHAAGDRVLGALEEAGGGHDDVVAGAHRGGRGVGVVGLDVLLPDHAFDVVPVGDEGAGVAPLPSQHVAQQPVVDRDRDAVHGLVAEHERAAALAGDALEGRQEPGAELAAGDVRLARVASALGLGVPGEVLGRGQDRGRVVQAVALVAADHRRGHLADEEGVLAEGLRHAAPAQVTGDAQDGGEGPVDAGRSDLDRGGAGGLLHERGVPRRGQAELGRVDRGALPEGVAVDAVLGDEQRDLQAGGRGERVGLQDPLGGGVQDRAGVHVGDQRADAVLGVELQHLPDLLGQGHPGDQVGDPLGGGQVCVAVCGEGAHRSGLSRLVGADRIDSTAACGGARARNHTPLGFQMEAFPPVEVRAVRQLPRHSGRVSPRTS